MPLENNLQNTRKERAYIGGFNLTHQQRLEPSDDMNDREKYEIMLEL